MAVDLDELDAMAQAKKEVPADPFVAKAFAKACDPDTILHLIARARAGQNAAWQFNEAVSLLRECRALVGPPTRGLALEIDVALPAIQAALEYLAHSPQEASDE